MEVHLSDVPHNGHFLNLCQKIVQQMPEIFFMSLKWQRGLRSSEVKAANASSG